MKNDIIPKIREAIAEMERLETEFDIILSKLFELESILLYFALTYPNESLTAHTLHKETKDAKA